MLSASILHGYGIPTGLMLRKNSVLGQRHSLVWRPRSPSAPSLSMFWTSNSSHAPLRIPLASESILFLCVASENVVPVVVFHYHFLTIPWILLEYSSICCTPNVLIAQNPSIDCSLAFESDQDCNLGTRQKPNADPSSDGSCRSVAPRSLT